jgi:uncharacterized protein YaiI (UPF0178 family)
MKIWVDGDSVPRDIQSILVKRAERNLPDPGSGVTNKVYNIFPDIRFVCSKKLPMVPANLCIFVEPGPGSADNFIEANSSIGDIVITRDIPLAERLASRDIAVLNDRGVVFSKGDVAQRRSERDASLELRKLGLLADSPRQSTRSAKETKLFADALDRTLTKLVNSGKT